MPIFHIGILHYGIYYTSIFMNKVIYTQEHKLIVKQLKRARLESGLNQKEVSEKLKKTQSYISKIESGQRRIDLVQLKEFSKLYKKHFNFFIKE